MKKLIFSFFLCGATMFPAFSQTYQELSERAVAATEQDSLSLAEKYIEQALKRSPPILITLCCAPTWVRYNVGSTGMSRLLTRILWH